MAIAFYISPGRDSLPNSSTTYVIEKFNGNISIKKLNSAVDKFTQHNEDDEIFGMIFMMMTII